MNYNPSNPTVGQPGNVIHQAGQLNFNGGQLEIAGDFLQRLDIDGDGIFESACYGRIVMSNPADYMLVKGNAEFFMNPNVFGVSYFSAGTVEVRGDFHSKIVGNVGARSFPAVDAHRVFLNGSSPQTVKFDNPQTDFFSILEVANPNVLIFDSPVRASRVLGNPLSSNPLSIQSSGAGGISGTFDTDITYTAASFTMLSVTDLNGHHFSLNCGVEQKEDLRLNGGTMTVGGDFLHQSGRLYFNDGRLEISGDFLQRLDIDGDGIFESPCYGRIFMSNPADYMRVEGDAEFFMNPNVFGVSYFSAGTLEVKGGFHSKVAGSSGSSSFPAYGNHRVLLSGSSPQTVKFDNPQTDYFSILKVTNHMAVTSKISIKSGGALNLDYAGTDVVSALYIAGTLQPNGVYDSTNTGGLITGTGKIQVGPFASYSAWTDVNAPGQNTDQDHDHDGVANGIEYFMGKTGDDFTVNPGVATDGTVTWPKSPAFNGSYAVQTSADLSTWTDVTNDPAQVTTNANSVIWTRPSGVGNRFVRLVVIPN